MCHLGAIYHLDEYLPHNPQSNVEYQSEWPPPKFDSITDYVMPLLLATPVNVNTRAKSHKMTTFKSILVKILHFFAQDRQSNLKKQEENNFGFVGRPTNDKIFRSFSFFARSVKVAVF